MQSKTGNFFIYSPFIPKEPQKLAGGGASFAFTVKISAKREAPDVATFDESIAEGAMDEEKGATDGCLAAGRKLTGKVNEARRGIVLISSKPGVVLDPSTGTRPGGGVAPLDEIKTIPAGGMPASGQLLRFFGYICFKI
jgi:hypothetical protein